MKKAFLLCSAFIFSACAILGNVALLRVFPSKADMVCSAQAACVMEQNSRRVLYESGGDLRLPMASTTKIATAITVLEECENITQKFAIPQAAEGIEGSSVYLKSGDKYSVEDLLYGLMLRSGNDCATALALYCAESIEQFSADMNKTAQKAGALSTNFVNPHGLPAKNHYTTARDLSNITCYAMQNPIFRKIVSTQYYEPYAWKNKNKLLMRYEGAIGVKTGYTKEAGRCLVSAAERRNMTLICTVLNCADTYECSERLLEDAFSSYQYVKLLDKNEIFEITDGKQKKAKVLEDFYYPLLEEEIDLIKREFIFNNLTVKKDENGEILGQIQIRLAKYLLFSANLYKL
ncbi:MAG: D-alanyl-D-alanine carboxypeptidase [Clostridia bacterium]|nr:D-alanyl-D-alanine carboxypeptidase [Clostridia bacterium]